MNVITILFFSLLLVIPMLHHPMEQINYNALVSQALKESIVEREQVILTGYIECHHPSEILYSRFDEDNNYLVISCKKVQLGNSECYITCFFHNGACKGFAEFSLTKKCGSLNLLKIFKESDRRYGYGSLLFACVIKKLADIGCTKAEGLAMPLDAFSQQSEMLPKLIAFYQQFGAEVTEKDIVCARMSSSDPKKAFKRIYTIFENWETKDLRTVALSRAQILTNQLAQSAQLK